MPNIVSPFNFQKKVFKMPNLWCFIDSWESICSSVSKRMKNSTYLRNFSRFSKIAGDREYREFLSIWLKRLVKQGCHAVVSWSRIRHYEQNQKGAKTEADWSVSFDSVTTVLSWDENQEMLCFCMKMRSFPLWPLAEQISKSDSYVANHQGLTERCFWKEMLCFKKPLWCPNSLSLSSTYALHNTALSICQVTMSFPHASVCRSIIPVAGRNGCIDNGTNSSISAELTQACAFNSLLFLVDYLFFHGYVRQEHRWHA